MNVLRYGQRMLARVSSRAFSQQHTCFPIFGNHFPFSKVISHLLPGFRESFPRSRVPGFGSWFWVAGCLLRPAHLDPDFRVVFARFQKTGSVFRIFREAFSHQQTWVRRFRYRVSGSGFGASGFEFVVTIEHQPLQGPGHHPAVERL